MKFIYSRITILSSVSFKFYFENPPEIPIDIPIHFLPRQREKQSQPPKMLSSSSLGFQHSLVHLPLIPKTLTPCLSNLQPEANPKSQFHLRGLTLLRTPSLAAKHGLNLVAVRSKPRVSSDSEQQKWSQEGLVTESLPNGMFRIRLDNADMIIGYISGKIRKSFIRILPGDRVKVEVTRYDSTRGRIVYRLRNTKDSS